MKVLILTEDAIRREIRAGNLEVLVAIAFAIQPTLFADKVEAYKPDGFDGFRFVIKDSGNSYAMFNKDILKIAIEMMHKTGLKPEILSILN